MFNDKGEPKMFTDQQPEQNEQQTKKKDKTVILVVALMAIILVGLVVLYNLILNDTFNQPTPPQTTTNAGFKTTTTTSVTTTMITDTPVVTTTAVPTSTTTTTTKPAQIEYDIKIKDMDKNEVRDFKLGGQVLQVKMKKNEAGKFEFEMTFNDKKFSTQKLSRSQDIKVYLMGNTLIYINMEKGNADYKHMYIMRENKLQKVYEFESIKGMVPDTFAIQDNKFIVYASRVSDDGKSIKYGTAMGINVCDESTWSLDFTKSSVIKATYTYTLTNKRLSEQPIYNDPVRVDTYIASGACN